MFTGPGGPDSCTFPFLMTRYSVMLLVFATSVAVPSFLARASAADGGLAVRQGAEDIPPAVREAAHQGRYWRASRILGDYLAVAADTAPETILFASRLSAGWGDWPTVTRLLEGRQWLGDLEGAEGWKLLGLSRIRLGRLEEGSEALDRYLDLVGDDSPDRGTEYLRRGLAVGAAGQTLVALTALERAVEVMPWMADWANYFAAEIVAPAGDTAEVRRRLAAAGPVLGARGWRFQVDAARQAGDLLSARQLALAAARGAGSPGARASGWALLGDLRLEGGDTAQAREAYRSAMEGAPGVTAAVDAARGLSRLGPSPDEWRMIGSIYLRHGNQPRAIAAFESYLAAGIGTADERAQVRLQLGQALLDAGRFQEAERRLLALADSGIPARIAADAMYHAGRAQHRHGRTAEALRTFARLADRFPGQDGTARALYLMADLQHDALEIDAAKENYRRAASAAPTLNEAGLALMRLGGLEYLAGNHQEALDVFEEYRRLHPTGRRIAQATYWAARSYQALGREGEARAVLRELRRSDPLSYYGIRAGELLGEAALAIPMEPEPPPRERTDSLVRNGLRRVDVLEDLGRRSDVVHEVERLREHFSREDGHYTLAEALNERGYTLTAISMGWDIYRREGAWNPRLLRLIYPYPFQDLVRPEAADWGVDPYLVAAVIRRESAFNPTVTSSAGAIGLMQIMPRTGRGLAQAAGMNGYDPELLRQPELNVHLGVRYLASLLQQYQGDLALVLSAYNAGPSRANRWRTLPEARDPELLMERIPFAETRDYVRNVKINLALYRELYPDAHTRVGAASD
jgi:soluble lytic murein transglycosylase